MQHNIVRKQESSDLHNGVHVGRLPNLFRLINTCKISFSIRYARDAHTTEWHGDDRILVKAVKFAPNAEQ